jgi:hypothetical protein
LGQALPRGRVPWKDPPAKSGLVFRLHLWRCPCVLELGRLLPFARRGRETLESSLLRGRVHGRKRPRMKAWCPDRICGCAH